ncbi:hypothetical protein CWB96_19085 [Pseudoalteromonas citrea]|uniref:Uncharacterized protein n=1 Tax=Pseudoalteromonas citrea TaxID=43655 RepID=A0A5S3XJG4_9GAMM|nr:hypothetical protein CWB97_12285 [Pseudoalteromonas citrea]TMP54588.1 hypothetical protein CWB96_19085 [Pseudoalteromonas citrea]
MVCGAEYKKKAGHRPAKHNYTIKKCAKEDKNKPTSLLTKTLPNNVHKVPSGIKPLNVKYMLN